MGESEWALLIALAVIVFFVAACALMIFLFDLYRDRRYIKFQLRHSADWEEYHYWKRELRVLYLTLIPGMSRSRARRLVSRKTEK